MPLSFRQLGACFAAEVSPIDLRQVHDPATLAELRAGMDRYADHVLLGRIADVLPVLLGHESEKT